MKKIAAVVIVLLLLTGCSENREELNQAMALRAKMQSRNFAFAADITADYGDKVYTFSMDCQGDAKGSLKFKVTKPETLSGITGTVSEEGGKLTFDDHALAFDTMADGQISPVTGPWILIKTLQSGYLTSCAKEGEKLRVAVDDSYQDDALHLDIWLNGETVPERSEIFWKGRRLLSIAVTNFHFL